MALLHLLFEILLHILEIPNNKIHNTNNGTIKS